MIAKTPSPPYYAVIFSSMRTDVEDGYSEMDQKMDKMAQKQPGYLGHESVREGLGITVSYWKDLESIKNWKANMEHVEAQKKGRSLWYSSYKTRICRVEKDYDYSL